MPEHSIVIAAAPAAVWEALTVPAQMTRWMGEPEMKVEVLTDWRVGGPIVVRGFHVAQFHNTGTVLAFEPPCLLRYSHLDSISRLPDTPENHSVLEFRLTPVAAGTALTIAFSGFPTESIFKHLDFYWRGTLGVLKRHVEAGA